MGQVLSGLPRRFLVSLFSLNYLCVSSSASMHPVIIPAPKTPQTATLIFLHGLGDDGNGWATAWSTLLAKQVPGCKIICPNAPMKKVTLNYGMRMPSWYDIYTLEEGDQREDSEGLQESAQMGIINHHAN
jgi:predicted esterase